MIKSNIVTKLKAEAKPFQIGEIVKSFNAQFRRIGEIKELYAMNMRIKKNRSTAEKILSAPYCDPDLMRRAVAQQQIKLDPTYSRIALSLDDLLPI